MKSFLIGFALGNARFIDISPADDMDKKADGLCKDFVRDFHGVINPNFVTNVEINNGHQGSVSFKIISGLNRRPMLPWYLAQPHLRYTGVPVKSALTVCIQMLLLKSSSEMISYMSST